MKKIYLHLLFCLAIALSFEATANNVQISSVNLSNDSTITFSVSWENSWRVGTAPNNHDAVWVFIKKKDCASGQWSHVDLSSSLASHSAAAPLEVFIDGKDASAAKGVFLRRSAVGAGNVSSTTVSLRMVSLPIGEYDFRVLGVEMVQIPEGSFQLGDGDVSVGSFTKGNTGEPYNVTSEAAIGVSTSASSIYTSSTAYRPVTLPATYPKGFAEIYCMKYEISQGQYVDFVNMLTSDQAANRENKGTSSRMNITGTWPVLLANAPHRAMNFLAWADFLAYLDWSALRPMTELEYEKVARGPVLAVGGEYAWGTAIITDANTLINDGTNSEAATNPITAGGGIANYNNTTILGPIRTGFAAKTATSRLEAGASYYGVMDLSGNVWEQVITTRLTTGTAFTGKPGDGVLTTTPSPGYANQATWPSPEASISLSNSASGCALRGGAWNTAPTHLRLSDRASSSAVDGRRLGDYGGRGVR